jgi:hypothetical protein
MMSGEVLSVETRNLAESATAAAAIAATTLYVADASTFDENGGLITVGGVQLAYAATDVDLNTISLVAGLAVAVEENDPIEVFPPTPVRTALIDIGEEGGDAVPATVPHSLLDRLPDGTRDPAVTESVTLEERGTYELVVADIIGEQLAQQSLDYVEGEEGIGLSEAVAQVQDLNAIGQVNASGITVDTINLGGVDLMTQLGATSVGKLISARLPAPGSNIALTGTNTKVFELNCGIVPGGRTYRVSTNLLLVGTAPLALTDRVLIEYRYTADGSTPTTASAEMDGGLNDNSYQAGVYTAVRPEAEIDIVTTAPIRIAVCARVVAGSGAYAIYAGPTAKSRPVMALYDDGPLGARQDSAITLTGGGISRFVKTYNATWGFGVNSDYGSTILDSYFYIGGESDAAGFVGFDGASMVAQLAASATPVSCVVRWRPRSRQTAAGLDARIATHNFSSSSAAAAPSGGLPYFANTNLAGYGLTLLSNIRNNAVPGTYYEESLGVTVFNQFKAGSRKGIAFLGTPPGSVTGGAGTVYGDGGYQVQLIFTYDGTS